MKPSSEKEITDAFQALSINPGYLGLENIPSGEECIISFAPINSSGDIYHILGYLILAAHHQMRLPMVELSYDLMIPPWGEDKGPSHSKLTVGDQVKRAKSFAETLSFEGQFVLVEQQYNNTGRENARHDELCKRLQEKSNNMRKNIWFLDQMACTTLIASYAQQNGYEQMSAIMRAGFSKRNTTYFAQQIQNNVDVTVNKWLKSVDDSRVILNQPLVVFHIRYSSKANKEQNLPDDFIINCAKMLSQTHQYQVCIILADDRKRKMSIPGATNIIEPFKNNLFFASGCDYSKQAHLQLILGFQKNQRTKAIIGNTSGTLDLAALVGITTYSIHQFTQSKISYQECRLFIQMWFMSIDALVQDSNHSYGLSQSIEEWLKNPLPGLGPTQWKDMEQVRTTLLREKEKAGFYKMFSLTLFSHNSKESHRVEIPGAANALNLNSVVKSHEATKP